MILAALDNYYERLLDQAGSTVAPVGYSYEKIGFALVLSATGKLIDGMDLRDTSGKLPRAKSLCVPQPEKRTAGIKPFFLWDKSSYVLGVGSNKESSEGKKRRRQKRIAEEHAAFKAYHEEVIGDTDDEGLEAVLEFLRRWEHSDFEDHPLLTDDWLDANIVFRLDGEQQFVHERPAARKLRQKLLTNADSKIGTCLVTGDQETISRLHPSVKGVKGAQSSGASIVSFNLDASESYGRTQGYNAPVSEKAVFAYTTALNHLLRSDSDNQQRVQIGDATTIFWAEADTEAHAEAAEQTFARLLNPQVTDDSETDRLRGVLQKIVEGKPLGELNADLDEDTRIYVLGLAPNASRLSIRYWETGSLGLFARRLTEHYQDLQLEPLPWKREPGIWRLLLQTVPHPKSGTPKSDDIPPQLAGELMRSILTGQRYPRSLLTQIIMRFRADGDISGLRVALCKAALNRDRRLNVKGMPKEIPVSLDTSNIQPGYRLGRLFAALENVQRRALGARVNATIRDRYYGAASATPASVFPVLIRNSQHHLSRLRKDSPGLAATLEKELGEIMNGLPPSFPKNLRIEAQGQFAIGYYHQSQSRFQSKISEEGEVE